MRVGDKVGLATGAASRIGRAIATRLASEGAAGVVNTIDGGRSLGLRGD